MGKAKRHCSSSQQHDRARVTLASSSGSARYAGAHYCVANEARSSGVEQHLQRAPLGSVKLAAARCSVQIDHDECEHTLVFSSLPPLDLVLLHLLVARGVVARWLLQLPSTAATLP